MVLLMQMVLKLRYSEELSKSLLFQLDIMAFSLCFN